MTYILESKSLHRPSAPGIPQDLPGLEISEECHSGGFQGPWHGIDEERTWGEAEENYTSETRALRYYREPLIPSIHLFKPLFRTSEVPGACIGTADLETHTLRQVCPHETHLPGDL